MNCREWEDRVALHAGGDLGENEAAEVERHLAECVECRAFAEELRASLGVLREAHRDEIPPAHYAAVRVRVLGQLERRRRPWRLWAWAGAGAAVAAAAVVGVLVFWGSGTGIPAGVDLKPTQARMPVPLTQVRPPATRVRRTRKAMPPKRPEKHEPLVVKLLTDDPNVVIYWITSEGDD